MIDLDFEKRLRAAARASVDGFPVPPPPGSLRQLRADGAQRRSTRWWWAAAASLALGLAGATDGGRAAIANVVQHAVSVFSIDPDTGKRNAVSAIGMQDALSTSTFHVIEPRGLPVGAKLVSIYRIGDPETGRPSVLFQYAVGGRPLDILENGVTHSGSTASQAVRSLSTLPERHEAAVKIVTPRIVTFRAGRTRIVVTSDAGTLSTAEIEAIRAAMTRS